MEDPREGLLGVEDWLSLIPKLLSVLVGLGDHLAA